MSVASFARCTLLPYTDNPMPARMTMRTMTIIISIRVNPDVHGGRAGAACCSFIYQSLYFVPSSASPSLLVYTSNTFCPPQLLESGLSW